MSQCGRHGLLKINWSGDSDGDGWDDVAKLADHIFIYDNRQFSKTEKDMEFKRRFFEKGFGLSKWPMFEEKDRHRESIFFGCPQVSQ